jgi:hypothetical protein
MEKAKLNNEMLKAALTPLGEQLKPKEYFCDNCSTKLGEIACSNQYGGSYCSSKCAKEDEMRTIAKNIGIKFRPDELKKSNPIKPDHYHHGGLDVFTIMEANMPEDLEGFFCGNVLKYTIRQKRKNGIEDLEKAKEYLENWIAFKKKQL